MPITWIKNRPLKEEYNTAMSEYAEAVKQEDEGHHRDGYIWYRRSKSSLLDIETKFVDTLTQKNKETITRTLQKIESRLPLCAALAAEEIIKIKTKLNRKKRLGQLASYVMTQQDIITNYDDQMFLVPLNKKQKALIPKSDEEEEYTDESTDEEDILNSDYEQVMKRANRKLRRQALKGCQVQSDAKKPPVINQGRPRKPRVLTKKFKKMMSSTQKWDSVKHLVYTKLMNVKWSDVIGYTEAKKLLYHTIVFEAGRQAQEQDEHGTSCLAKSRSVLLYGPPGTGKSQLADAVATEATGNVFIKASGSELMSKYLGESEKNLALLFEMANDLRPAIIYFDECDAVFASRSANDSQATVNIAATLLNLMSTYRTINIIATTNLPWNIDPAFVRRFNKRSLLDMPTQKERAIMLKYCLRTLFTNLTEADYEDLSHLLEGYSGNDIRDLNVTIFDLQNEQFASARYFKFCPLRPKKIIPCVSTDPDPSVIKAHWTSIPSYNWEKPLLSYNDIRSIIKSYGRKSIDEEIVKNLREYEKNPGGGDPSKKKKEQPQIIYRNGPNLPQSYTGGYSGVYGY